MSLITVSKGNIEDVHCEARIVEDISLVLYEEGHIKLSIIYHEEEGCDNDEVLIHEDFLPEIIAALTKFQSDRASG